MDLKKAAFQHCRILCRPAPGESAFFSPQGHGMLKGAGTNLARETNVAIPNKFSIG